ncbi:MAG: hypothetical protein Q9178_007385 [Gyalolechia marmorata]
MPNKQKTLPIIVILGPPGAGKSHLCNRAAAETPNVEHVIMSDLLREERNRPGSPWAQEIKDKLPSGTLVSSELSTAVLQAWYNRQPQDHTVTYLLDGFPRNIEQAGKFAEKLGIAKATISLSCSEQVMEERLKERGRYDDDPKVARERYSGYLNETVPAIMYLEDIVPHVVSVSSDKQGDEGWLMFKEALLQTVMA